MKTKHVCGRYGWTAFVCTMAVLAAGVAAFPVRADTHDAVISGNFTPGHVVTAKIPELESGEDFTGTYKWYRTRISGDREPEVLESGQQWGRFSTYEITGEDVGWCISFSAAGTGKYMDDYVYSYSYYVYPLIDVELFPDAYGHPGYVAAVSTPGYDVETTDNWLQFSYDWYTSTHEDGEYVWYSGEVTTETESWIVLPDTAGARYLKVRVMLDQGESKQEAEAVVELPWEDGGQESGAGSAEGDGSGDSGNGDGSGGTGGDSGNGDGSGGTGGGSGNGDGSGDSDGSGSSVSGGGSGGSSGSGDDPSEKPEKPGPDITPATPSNAEKPSGNVQPEVPADSGNTKPEKPAVSQPSGSSGGGKPGPGAASDPSGSGKPGPGTASDSSGSEAGNQPATPFNAGGSGGGSLGTGGGRGGSRSYGGEAGNPSPESSSQESGTESLDLTGVPAAGRKADTLPRTGDDSHPEVYRTIFAVSLLAIFLIVLNDENDRYHRILEMMRKQKRRPRYSKERRG